MWTLLAAATILVGACANDSVNNESTGATDTTPGGQSDTKSGEKATSPLRAEPRVGPRIGPDGRTFPEPPAVPSGPVAEETAAQIEAVIGLFAAPVAVFDGSEEGIARLGSSEDARLGWVLSDLVRFIPSGPIAVAAAESFTELTGAPLSTDDIWLDMTNHLLAWDLPAPPEYFEWKRTLFTTVEPRWDPFFDPDADIDWRALSWGGVFLDDRPFGDARTRCGSRGCIAALDDPDVVTPAEDDWYDDERLVFGVVVHGEARAYPKNIMEIHEMINDEVGGRRLGIPYCTLCGSAEAYFTDVAGDVDAASLQPHLVLRTSGLLTRSNKVMFDLDTRSVFDTFTGRAVSGPLHERGVQLESAGIVTTTWGEWKQEHPNTTIVAPDGGVGRIYPDDPLAGRDDDGPIFAVGDVDQRLAAQHLVLGAQRRDGSTVAFDAAAARTALRAGQQVALDGVRVQLDAGGLRAFDADGIDLGAGESFWFAWSQFHPDTQLWPGDEVDG